MNIKFDAKALKVMLDRLHARIEQDMLDAMLYGATGNQWDSDMATLPKAISFLQNGSPAETRTLLAAAILASEEDMLVITEKNLDDAKLYKLVVTVGDDNTVVIIVEPKK